MDVFLVFVLKSTHSNIGALLRGQIESDPLTLHQTRYLKIGTQ
jgi:hypothetical protein